MVQYDEEIVIKDFKEKMCYLKMNIMPGLEEAFKRGDRTYHGNQHNSCPRIMDRCAKGGDIEKSLSKIESAIGYLIILRSRVSEKKGFY